jgi:vWA-MoxR associated protein C-terminal domain/Effector-associated domain 1
VSIDWNDGGNREKFRLALEKAYPDYDLLEMFVDEKLNESLAIIAAKEELSKVIYKLLKWAKSQHRFDELLKKFCEANHRTKDSLIAELTSLPLIGRSVKVFVGEWESLFALFSSDDIGYMQIAFRQAFKAAYDRLFVDMRPDRPPMENPKNIQDLLTNYDDPILAVRFVEFMLVEFRRSSEYSDRDLTTLEQWRDRIAERFQVPDPVQRPPKVSHAYLLVTLEENGPDVVVYPELRITDGAEPIKFGAERKTCSFDEVADWISEWIIQAEDTLLDCDLCENKEVTLELFLPCQYLVKDEDIATTWIVKNERGESVNLGIHRRFVVRSTYRIHHRKIQAALKTKWQEFQDCVQAGNICSRFHPQNQCPQNRGELLAILNDNNALGLKFVAQMPTDRTQRASLLNDIISSAIPIALWTSPESDLDASSLGTEFNNLLKGYRLDNFADLATKWRSQRLKPTSAKYIKLLCDRPDRLPRLPDPENRPDTDALVAS